MAVDVTGIGRKASPLLGRKRGLPPLQRADRLEAKVPVCFLLLRSFLCCTPWTRVYMWFYLMELFLYQKRFLEIIVVLVFADMASISLFWSPQSGIFLFTLWNIPLLFPCWMWSAKLLCGGEIVKNVGNGLSGRLTIMSAPVSSSHFCFFHFILFLNDFSAMLFDSNLCAACSKDLGICAKCCCSTNEIIGRSSFY